jgi:hypothetical protein
LTAGCCAATGIAPGRAAASTARSRVRERDRIVVMAFLPLTRYFGGTRGTISATVNNAAGRIAIFVEVGARGARTPLKKPASLKQP